MKNGILILAFTLMVFTACQPKAKQTSTSTASVQTSVASDTKVNAATTATPLGTYFTLTVQGKCDMCKARIEKAAMGVAGVAKVDWVINTKTLHIGLDPKITNVAAVSKAIAAAGHDTNLDKATETSYDALPSCCKYR